MRAGYTVSMELFKNILLIVGDQQGILDQLLRLHQIHLFNLLIMFNCVLFYYLKNLKTEDQGRKGSLFNGPNTTYETAHIRHQCRKTTVLSFHRCLIQTGVEKMNHI